MGKPSVYPTGVTKYIKDSCENGYTVFPSYYGATAVDMNGRLVKIWSGFRENPMKPLPGGRMLANLGKVPGGPGMDGNVQAVMADWNGKIIWSCGDSAHPVNHHHDYEFEELPVYAAPQSDRAYGKDRVLLLTHHFVQDILVSDRLINDERLIETDREGNLLWQWDAHEHIDEMGISPEGRRALFNNPMMGGDWIHMNAVSTIGPNRHYDAGDMRFCPENIICSARQLNLVFIIEKQTGKIIWRLGPDYSASEGLRRIGQVIGQHHAHMIPGGLPGEGNILLFDNGSFGGYGSPSGTSFDGTNALRRHYSRILEIDPVKPELVWEYTKADRNAHDVNEMNAQDFFSPFISSVQRLANGNTLVCQGADGIMQEITPDKKVVWEFVNPIRNPHMPEKMQFSVYRAYRVPYTWFPVVKPQETDVIPPEIENYRVSGSCGLGAPEEFMTKVKANE